MTTNATQPDSNLAKREWVYLLKPASFDIAPCECGNHGVWSEFQEHLWCEVCEIDFIPKHSGVFDGPIPVGTAALMGITFDRYNLVTSKVERFNLETLEYVQES